MFKPKPPGYHEKINPEKLMLFMFPLITLGFFSVGVVTFYLLPKVLGGLF